ncbi:MAG: T9SS type A sorting domain-containing protein [Cyclobacteriaceae bacterium]
MTRLVKSKWPITILAIYLSIYGYAQTIEHQGIVSGGGKLSSEHHTLESSVGGLILANLSNNQNTLKHGYLGPSLVVDALSVKEPSAFEVVVYPNPFAQSFRIKSSSSHTPVQLSMVNLQGKVIMQPREVHLTDAFEMDLTEQPTGIYLLYVERESDTSPHIYKLTKTK